MTSSILPPRSALAPCSPSTQLMASTTLLLPEPLGPTTQVMPGSRRSVVAEAKDLKPLTVRLLRCTDLRGSTVDYWGAGYPDPVPAAVHAALGSRSHPGIRTKSCAPPRGGGARWCCGFQVLEGGGPPGFGGRRSSGQRRLGQPQNVVRLRSGCRETIILRPEAG